MSDLTLHVAELGDKKNPSLIFLHGWRQSLESLRPLAEFFSNDFHILLVDLPGFGGSTMPPSSWGTAEYAERIMQLMDEQQISRATFIGHSFGGKISLSIAITHPERVASLVLINSAGVKATPPLERRLKIFAIQKLRTVLRFLQKYLHLPLYDRWFVPRFASPDYKAAGPLREVFVRVVNQELSSKVPTITAPALLLWGEHDAETPVAAGQKLASLLCRSELVVLHGKDHFPFLGVGASLCAYHMKEFFKRTSSGSVANG